MKALSFVAVLSTVFGLSGAAIAADATLTSIKGNVLVSQGENYQSARDGFKVTTGNRIMVMEGASVTLSYSDGCVDNFKGGKVLQIAKNSSCDGGDIAVVSSLGKTVAATGGNLGSTTDGSLLTNTQALIGFAVAIPFIAEVASEIGD